MPAPAKALAALPVCRVLAAPISREAIPRERREGMAIPPLIMPSAVQRLCAEWTNMRWMSFLGFLS
jgi:hypothetical protein